MLKYLAITFISIGCVLGAANETATDSFADPYDMMEEVDELILEAFALDKELADLKVKKESAKKTQTDLETQKADLKAKKAEIAKKKEKVKTDAAEVVKATNEEKEILKKLDKVGDDLTAASKAFDEVSAQVRDKEQEVTDKGLEIAQIQKNSIGNDPTTDEVLKLLTNGVGSLFKVPEVVQNSSYAQFDLWEANLKACEKYWGQLKVKDQAEADKNSSAVKDIYADRVKADDQAIKACKDFATFVSESVTKPWKKKAADESKTEAEVTLDDFPVEEFQSAEAQYIHDFLVAEEMQAKTMLLLKKSDAPTKAKLEAVLEEMKEYKLQAKDDLKEANANEAAAKSSSAWIYIVVGVIAAIVIVIAVWKCYCNKPEEK